MISINVDFIEYWDFSWYMYMLFKSLLNSDQILNFFSTFKDLHFFLVISVASYPQWWQFASELMKQSNQLRKYSILIRYMNNAE